MSEPIRVLPGPPPGQPFLKSVGIISVPVCDGDQPFVPRRSFVRGNGPEALVHIATVGPRFRALFLRSNMVEAEVSAVDVKVYTLTHSAYEDQIVAACGGDDAIALPLSAIYRFMYQWQQLGDREPWKPYRESSCGIFACDTKGALQAINLARHPEGFHIEAHPTDDHIRCLDGKIIVVPTL